MSFPLSSTNASSLFVLIHSNVWHAPIVSNSGYRYYSLFLDDYTKFSWVYLMRKKSKSFDKFKEFYTMVKNVFNNLHFLFPV